MKFVHFLTASVVLIFCAFIALPATAQEKTYPAADARMKKSPGGTTYWIDPQKGKDKASGKSESNAWKTFLPLAAIKLAAGDTVVVKPGTHDFSLLATNGAGTAKAPITIKFLSGKHLFAYGKLWSGAFHISNTNDRPYEPKAVAIKIENTKYIRLVGEENSEILMDGKTIYIVTDKSENIKISDLTFDYLHPTMGEFRVTKRNGKTLEAEIPAGTQYEISNGRLTWKGPGWSFPLGGFLKVFNPDSGTFGGSFNPNGTTIEEISPGKIKITYNSGSPTLNVGQSIQNRDITRDCVGFLQRESKNIRWTNCRIHAIHGMGVVSQFSENISFDGFQVVPRKNSGRTNVTWADILHFSGCKGSIVVKNSTLTSSHDDAINVHGTHLRVVERVNDKTLVLRFMHNQTFGIEGFFPGDEVEFVHGKTLEPFGTNTVSKVEVVDERRLRVTFDKKVPENFLPEDAVENVTWTPSLHVDNVTVRNIPTRGFLVTTRRPVIIENCTFERTGMSAILVEDDASGWYESGPVKDMIIRKNKFIECAAPVVNINPHAIEGDYKVHENIRIEGNTFKLRGGRDLAIRSHHAKNVKEKGNRVSGRSPSEAVEIR